MEKVVLKDWTLQSERFGMFPASVPGDISADLQACGAIPDPFYADNVLHCREHLKLPFTYACTFALGREALSHAAAVLVLEGVDLFAEVYLNGTLLGKTENMFLAYEFPCKELLREGKNELRVRMLPVYDFLDESSSVKALFHGKGIALRTTDSALYTTLSNRIQRENLNVLYLQLSHYESYFSATEQAQMVEDFYYYTNLFGMNANREGGSLEGLFD